jgi:hypothetical protein
MKVNKRQRYFSEAKVYVRESERERWPSQIECP